MVAKQSFLYAGGCGDRSASITVTTNAAISGGSIGNLVNGSYAYDTTGSLYFTNGQTGRYVRFNFGTQKIVAKLALMMDGQAGSNPGTGTWKLQGSNDASTWTDLSGNVSLVIPNNTAKWCIFEATSPAAYQYYQIVQNGAGTVGSSPWWIEAAFEISDPAGDAAVSGTYATPFSVGKRANFVTLTSGCTEGNLFNANPDRILDGLTVNDNWFLNNRTNAWMKFEFLVPVGLDQVTWYQDIATTHGTWKWQYSDDDSTWTDVGSPFTFGGTTQVQTELGGNTTIHKFWRCQQVSGTTSSSCYTREITFRLFEIESGNDFIDTVTPIIGTSSGGTTVTITGFGFSTVTDVKFGGTSATSFTIIDNLSMTAVTPAHVAGLVNVVAERSAGGDLTLVNGFTFSLTPTPIFTSVTPDTLPTTGGTITIAGDNLSPVTDVFIDGISVAFTIVNDETITVNHGAHSSGLVDIEIQSAGGNVIADDALEFTPVAHVTQVPVLALIQSYQPVRVTQLPILAISLPNQGLKVTQLPVLGLALPKPIPSPLPVVPETSVKEVWQYATVINIMENAKEQRSCLRQSPRVLLDFGVVILDDTDREEIYQLFIDSISRAFNYPIYHNSAALQFSVAEAATKLYFDPAATDLRVGEYAALFDPFTGATLYVAIASVDLDGATLETPVATSIRAGTLICAAPLFRTAPLMTLKMRTIDGDASFSLEALDQRNVKRPNQAEDLLTFVDGLLVLDKVPLADSDVDETFETDTVWNDNDINAPSSQTLWSTPLVSGERSYLIHRPAGMDYWRAVSDHLRGRWKPFLLPTFRNDLPLAHNPALGSSVLVSTAIQFAKFFELNGAWSYLRIQSRTGVIYRRIVATSINYSSLGDPETISIQLASPLETAPGSNHNLLISFATKCRLNSDEIAFEHGHVDSIVSIRTRMINA